MNKYRFIRLPFLLLFLACSFFVQAQEAPFQKEIDHFKSLDSAQFPPAGAILFAGSSSFRKWTDVADYFPGYTIINRGFGGSCLPDLIHYAPDIIFPYHPRQILIYCGDNDFAVSDTVTPILVFHRFKELYHMIREKLPDVAIGFVSIKPSPSRVQLMQKMDEANRLIRKFLRKEKNAAFIDVYHKMLDKTGQPDKDIFTSDMLHMNGKGYAIWQQVIRPYLLKD